MKIAGILGEVSLTPIGNLVRSTPGSAFGVIAMHPGIGADAAITIVDASSPEIALCSISVSQSNPVASASLRMNGNDVDLAYYVTVSNGTDIGGDGASFTVSETKDAAHVMAVLPGNGDGGPQGINYGTFDDLAALEAAYPDAVPGSFGTGRDGTFLVFQAGA
jgi:hypothetical protein